MKLFLLSIARSNKDNNCICIAMSEQQQLHFLHHIVREQAKTTKNSNITRCKRKLRGYDNGRSPTQQSIFSDAVDQNDDGNELVVQEVTTTGISLMSYCK
jgi:hypothetical protein